MKFLDLEVLQNELNLTYQDKLKIKILSQKAHRIIVFMKENGKSITKWVGV